MSGLRDWLSVSLPGRHFSGEDDPSSTAFWGPQVVGVEEKKWDASPRQALKEGFRKPYVTHGAA